MSLLVMAHLHGTTLAGESHGQPPPNVLGRWTQDEATPLLTTRKVFTFQPDGKYDFLLTARSPGSIGEHVLEREAGHYEVEAGRIVLSPVSGGKRAYRVSVESDPALGQPSLVLTDGDGARSRYYR